MTESSPKSAVNDIGLQREIPQRVTKFVFSYTRQIKVAYERCRIGNPDLFQSVPLRKSKTRIKYRKRDPTDLNNLDGGPMSTVTMSKVGSSIRRSSLVSSQCRRLARIIGISTPTLIHVSISLKPSVVGWGPTADHSPKPKAEADHVTFGDCRQGFGIWTSLDLQTHR